jgi:hypothetical protein
MYPGTEPGFGTGTGIRNQSQSQIPIKIGPNPDSDEDEDSSNLFDVIKCKIPGFVKCKAGAGKMTQLSLRNSPLV